ncbi:hypothetical protein SteCoe_38884 [Stentor coeruleus]|uniref:ADP/ATP translocase n=1 Tax=Stentor coeruleus TaxID=5963 RepID=A0A1R2AL74_9CILI|nr:hypothetical protein SteCoe_38884 [Stentor coeruleus]
MEKRDSGVKMYMKRMQSEGFPTVASMILLSPLYRYVLINQTRGLSKSSNAYNSISSYIINVPSREGYLGYWRGTASSLAYFFLSSLISFRTYLYIRGRIFSNTDPSGNELLIKEQISNMITFTISELIAYPLERARTLVSCDLSLKGELRNYSGAYDCIQKSMNRTGIKSWYYGFTMYLGTYTSFLIMASSLWNLVKENKPELAFGIPIVVKSLLYPLEVLRRRRQIGDGIEYKEDFKAMHRQIMNIFKTEGIRGFYRGFLAAGVHSSLTFGIFMYFSEKKVQE